MFKQGGSKKQQTVLNFGQKSSKPMAVRNTRDTTATRTAPYQSASRPTAGLLSRQQSASSFSEKISPYFAHTAGAQRPVPHQEQYNARKPGGKYGPVRNASRGDPVPIDLPSVSASASEAKRSANVSRGESPAIGNVEPSKQLSLSKRQLEAFDLAVNQRQSVFITGSAGTGKSVLLREIIRAFTQVLRMRPGEVQTTASTGIAAFHIRGKTIHSFAGVGYGKGTPAEILSRVRKNGLATRRWNEVKVLIIDEISMLDGALFDALEHVAREVRKSTQFFGGIQLILTGDFYQLPPVDKNGAVQFAFESAAWRRGVVNNTVVLTHVFRQKDMRFVDILNEMRLGRLSERGVEVFKSLSRTPVYPDDGIQATELYALRNQVDSANLKRLQSLPGKPMVFNAFDSLDTEHAADAARPVAEDVRVRIDGWSMAPRRLELKQHAQVMLVKNMPESGLVNGSRGVILRFEMLGNREYPVVRFTNGVELTITPEASEIDLGRERYKRTQLPLILAWALSIHKSQGQTIDRVLVDLGKVFEKGQAYVALSRAVSLDSLQVLNFNPTCVMAHPRVIQYYADLAKNSS